MAFSTFEKIGSIALLRGAGIGDAMMALPAVRALAAAYPQARVTFVGTAAHRAIVEGRCPDIHDFEVLPADPSQPHPQWGAWNARMRQRAFDLAIQMHGGGANSNPVVAAWGARHTVGSVTSGALPLERTTQHTFYQSEIGRWLDVAALAGADPTYETGGRYLTPLPADVLLARSWCSQVWPQGGWEGIVLVHPGASDPRRHWPLDSFAHVCARLAEDGYRVAVVGGPQDRQAAAYILTEAHRLCTPTVGARIVSLAGAADFAALIGLMSVAQVFVGNDSGPRHLAQVLGVPTVAVYWAPNVINAAGVSRLWHRVQMSWQMECSVCGQSLVACDVPRCPHEDSVVSSVSVSALLEDVREVLAQQSRYGQDVSRE